MMPPGSRALAFASRWFDPATVHRTFEPLIAYWQREWIDAPTTRRRRVFVRGMSAFMSAATIFGFRSLQSPTPGAIVWRIVIRLLIYMIAVMLCIPAVVRPEIAVAAMPGYLQSAFTIALPYSMLVAVDAIRARGDMPSHLERRAAMQLVLVSTIVMLAASDWSVSRAVLPALWMWTRWSAIDRQHEAGRLARLPIVPMAIVLIDMIFFVDVGRDHALLTPPYAGLVVMIALSFSAVPEHWWTLRRART
jgi:hypothetical protein